MLLLLWRSRSSQKYLGHLRQIHQSRRRALVAVKVVGEFFAYVPTPEAMLVSLFAHSQT